jgi:O-antigen/teichoic acid export membrane protein
MMQNPASPTLERGTDADACVTNARHSTPSVPAPASGWWRVVVDCTLVSGTTIVCSLLGMVTSLLFRMLLDPAQMGVWQGLKVFLSYSNYANLGVSKGATRDFTVAMGRGDTEAARHGLNLAFAVNTLSSLVFAAIPIGIGLWLGIARGWTSGWAVGLLVIGVLVVLQRHYTFQVTILRCAQAFGLTSLISILEAVLTLAFCGLATWLWGLWGLFGGTVAVMGVTLLVVQHRAAVPLSWAWDTAEIRRLVLIGSPMLLAGVVSTLFRSLDKMMILGYLSDREFQLGCYSVALLVTTQLYGLANMLSIVMGPRYGETFGQSGSRREVARLASRATELQSAAMALPAALAIVAAPAVLAWLLPNYRSGLAPLVWLVPGNIALSMALPASQYLVAVDRQNRALVAAVVATILAAAANHLVLTAGHGLIGVAVATSVGYGIYGLLTLAISLWPELDAMERLRLVGMQALINIPPVLLALGLETLWPGTEAGWLTNGAKMLAVLAVWGWTVALGWHHGRWAEARGR